MVFVADLIEIWLMQRVQKIRQTFKITVFMIPGVVTTTFFMYRLRPTTVHDLS